MKKIRFTKKDVLVLLIIFIYTGILITFSNADNDLIWNYGFSYNFANNLLMYKDYKMVITPLYPFLCGSIMHLLGNNFIIFNLLNTIIASIMYFYLYKKHPKTFIPSILLISFILRPSYNLLVLFLVLLIIDLDEERDFLLGLILGLIFLTKQSFILLILPSILLLNKPKRLLKRVLGFLIPCLFFLSYFLITKTLPFFLNYTLLGLFSFQEKNSFFNIGTIIILSIVIVLIVYYIKTKDIKVLYLITYQIMAYPIFNAMHIFLSIIPVAIYFLNTKTSAFDFTPTPKSSSLKSNYDFHYLNYFLSILLICPLLSIGLQYLTKDFKEGENVLKYKDIPMTYIVNKNTILEELPDINNTYFIMYDAYIYKYLLNKPINSYDLLLNGNMGYLGEEKVIEYFNSLEKTTYFLLNTTYEGGQLSEKIDNYIRANYSKVKSFNTFTLYEKKAF